MSRVLAPADQFFPPPDTKPVEPVPGVRGGVVPGFPGFPEGLGVGGGDADEASGLGISTVASSFRDRFWPKTVISFLLLAAILTIASIQFVTPTRRWRPSLPGPVRRLVRRGSAP